MPRLLIATNNRGKAAEYRVLLAGCGWDLVTPADLGLRLDVDETGADYAANARIKAQAFAEVAGLLTLADDSGLEVDALDGRPGPFSARHAGPNQTDEEGVALVLEQMKGVPPEKRGARFRCVIALAAPDGPVRLCEGECPGLIIEAPRGDNGFGYDPIFYLPERGLTIAELSADEKNAVSHRGRAARKACDLLREMLPKLPSDA
ncbi:MAG: XTP/dITP diphosphatase [Dehalococcoidia bacterium]